MAKPRLPPERGTAPWGRSIHGSNTGKGGTEIATTSEKPNVWQARRVGSGTFAVTKPKRKKRKLRQTRLKNRRRGR